MAPEKKLRDGSDDSGGGSVQAVVAAVMVVATVFFWGAMVAVVPASELSLFTPGGGSVLASHDRPINGEQPYGVKSSRARSS